MTLTPSDLKEILRYDPDTGKLFWLSKPGASAAWIAKYRGKEAFTADHGNGYRRGGISGKNYMAHRVIWALVHGHWPNGVIDHINGDRSDNRIANLRDVDVARNCQNRTQAWGASSSVGVVFLKKTGKWVAQIQIGTFDTEEEAAEAYRSAKLKIHV